MAVKQKTSSEIDALIDVPHAKTGVLVVERGTQLFDVPINNALLLASEASAGWLQVHADDSANTTARVMAGRAPVNGVTLIYAGGTIDLAAYNNDVAYVWLQDNGSGSAQISAAADGTGWPSGNHVKLAEVTLASGTITSILDRRSETFLADGSQSTGTVKSAFTVGLGTDTARLVLDNNAATGNFTAKVVPANLTANRTITIPDETGTIATQAHVLTAANAIKALLLTFDPEITVQGDTATPSEITIDVLDAGGNVLTGSKLFRVRICDSAGYAVATDAEVSVDTGTTLIESLTTDKDIVVASDPTTGKIFLLVTDATAETVTLRIGPAPLGAIQGNYSTTLNITHAAP